jgi:hypothetical protein
MMKFITIIFSIALIFGIGFLTGAEVQWRYVKAHKNELFFGGCTTDDECEKFIFRKDM